MSVTFFPDFPWVLMGSKPPHASSRLRLQLHGLLPLRRALARRSAGLGARGAARGGALEAEERHPGGFCLFWALVGS